MLEFISKLFGSKSDRDVKGIMPIVEKIKAEYAKIGGLTNDELRAKTVGFKQTIADGLADIDAQISGIKEQTESPENEETEKEEKNTQQNKLEKDRNKTLEEILMRI